MKVHIPNSAFLGNIESFLTPLDLSESKSLQVTSNPNWVSVHPIVLSAIAALAVESKLYGGPITCDPFTAKSVPYFIRMGLFDFLDMKPPQDVEFHAEEGRFIPLRTLRTSAELSEFIADMIPLLHADPQIADPIKYVVSELIRNVLEHSDSPVGAIICAQYFKKTKRISIGVADRGIGIQRTIGASYPGKTSLEAINLALRPGITGTTRRIGGTEFNAGAGLFFTRNIAKASKNYFYIHSGDAYFKQLSVKSTEEVQLELFPDPFYDKCTIRSDVADWKGTLVGIDMSADGTDEFPALLESIRTSFYDNTKRKRKEFFKKPKFI